MNEIEGGRTFPDAVTEEGVGMYLVPADEVAALADEIAARIIERILERIRPGGTA